MGQALPLPVIIPFIDFSDLQQWFEDKCGSTRISLSVFSVLNNKTEFVVNYFEIV